MIPRLVLNHASVDCTNAIHRVYCTEQGIEIGAKALALAMLSSVAQLSAEMFGRSYSGGVLKIEPGTSQRILLPTLRDGVERLFERVTTLMAEGQTFQAVAAVDDAVGKTMRLDSFTMDVVRQEATRLRRRRMQRQRSSERSTS